MGKVEIKDRVGKVEIRSGDRQGEDQGLKQGQGPENSRVNKVRVKASTTQGMQFQDQNREGKVEGWQQGQPKIKVRKG